MGLALTLLTGCASLPRCMPPAPEKTPRAYVKAIESQHVLELNPNGLLYDLRPHQEHQLITGEGEVMSYLQETIWAGFKQSGKTNLLLFIHGGLNDRDLGLQHYLDNYQGIFDRNYYPVFIVWPSGWRDTYLEHLLWVRQGIKMVTVGEKVFSLTTSPLMLFGDVGRGLARLPMVIANNTRSDRETIISARKLDGGSAVRDYQKLVAEGCLAHIEDDYSRVSDRIIRDTSYALTLPVKYFAASLIDGFGKGAWDNMLRRTQIVYPARKDPARRERVIEDIAAAEPSPTNPQNTRRRTRKAKRERRYAAAGLPAFFEIMEQLQKTDPTLGEITVVGHSMGTIILNRVARDTTINFANIVYLAAACSVEDFSTSVLPYVRQQENTQFYGLSLHPVAEAGEWYLIAGDLVPRGCLLVWTDNFLANPVSEEERTFGRWNNLFRSSATGEPVLRQFYDNAGSTTLKSRLHFRAFSVGFGRRDQLRPVKYQWNENSIPKEIQERCDNPLSHGDFPDLPYWLPDFWWKP